MQTCRSNMFDLGVLSLACVGVFVWLVCVCSVFLSSFCLPGKLIYTLFVTEL